MWGCLQSLGLPENVTRPYVHSFSSMLNLLGGVEDLGAVHLPTYEHPGI